jgi:hypothetical protein
MEDYQLPEASAEQVSIVKTISTHNVVVDSLAGGGKTSTMLHLAKEYPDKNILLLTYNARLKLETREKCEQLGINNLEIHSYHSFSVKNLDSSCYTDQGIINSLDKPLRDFKCEILILDEAQDITPVFYRLICKVIDRVPNAWICIIGDRHQSIYSYNGADSRFIIFADKLFPSERKWDQRKLSISYRITNQMAAFVNNVCLQKDRMGAVKNGCPVKYYYHGWHAREAIEEIREGISKYGAGEVMVLAPSVRSKNDKNPVRKLSNTLSKSGIPVFVPFSDSEKLDDEVLKGKVVFSSYHQAKGTERQKIILLGFDSSYYEFYNKTADPNICPNELYVALTRAKSELAIFHSNSKNHFSWLNQDLLDTFAVVEGVIKVAEKKDLIKTKIAVTDLTRHQTSIIINKCMKLIEHEQINPPEEFIDIPTTSEQYNSFGDVHIEPVSDVTGLALPSWFEYLTTGSMTIAKGVCADINDDLTPQRLLEIANDYIAISSGFKYKKYQIKEFNWLGQEELDSSAARLTDIIQGTGKYEVPVKARLINKDINGRLDCVVDDIIYEFKAVTELTPEHIIQTAVYAYICGPKYRYILFNILSGEQIEINHSEGLKNMMMFLLCNKFHKKDRLSDEEFFAQFGRGVTDDIYCHECAEYEA